MSRRRGRPDRKGLMAALAGSLVLCAAAGSVLAQQPPTAPQIIDALKTPLQTRGAPRSDSKTHTDAKTPTDEQRSLDEIRKIQVQSRAFTRKEREWVATIARDKPSIDIEINFDFDSAVLGPRALPV